MICYRIIILYSFLSLLLTHINSQNDIQINHFPLANQLPSSSVNRLLQDSDGYMWFGTTDGLCRYDGYNITVFRADKNNPDFLSDNEIICLAEDQNKNILICTSHDVNVLNKKNCEITKLHLEGIQKDNIKHIIVTTDGDIWIGTQSTLYRFNSDFTLKKTYAGSLPSTSINHIYEDKDYNIWVATWGNGLYKYDKINDSFTKYPKIGEKDNPFQIYQDNKKQFWICTWGDGLYLFNPDKENEIYVKREVFSKKNEIIDNKFYSITQDDVNNYIWIVSFSGIYAFKYNNINNLEEVDISTLFTNFNNIYSQIYKSRDGNLWIGTFNEGIINITFDKPNIFNYDLSSIKKNTGIAPSITCIHKDKEGVLWLNQNRIGLGFYIPESNNVKFLKNKLHADLFSNVVCISNFKSMPDMTWLSRVNSNKIYSVSRDKEYLTIKDTIDLSLIKRDAGYVQNFYEDNKKNIWIITTAGLFVKPYQQNIKFIDYSFGSITDITEDSSGNIWISTNKGIYKLPDINNFIVSEIYLLSKTNSNLKSNNITSICADNDNNLWIGSKEGFILLYNTVNQYLGDKSSHFRIINENIYNIIVDTHNNIWVLTDRRLALYNPQTKATRYYSHEDGIIVNAFRKNSYYIDDSGNILFGGNNGVCMFLSSARLSENETFEKPLITDLKINNKSILYNSNSYIFDLIASTVTLKPDDRNIEIDFSTLNLTFPNKIQYAYKMEGIDNDWVYTDYNRQFAFYNQLPKGNHVFLVKATDENGIWSNAVTEFKIYKQPAIYETWWAYLIYVFIISSIIYFIFRTIKNRIVLRNDLKIAKIQGEKIEELTQTKLRYFTNISHDFLTPLTIISCLIDDAEMTNKNKIKQIGAIRSNIYRLRRLLQQVLDFRKVESGNMKLKLTKGDIISFIRNLCFSYFKPLMERKNIDFNYLSTHDNMEAYFDADKIDKIIFNLLSNAYKYTPEHGQVDINLHVTENDNHTFLSVKISDTGIGIAEEDLNNIFSRFYTHKMSYSTNETNGIGLSLTKELLEIHHGNINVKSDINKGTQFSINFPIDKESYLSSEIDETELIIISEEDDILRQDNNLQNDHYELKDEETAILVVEDNEELLILMNNILSRRYAVKTAKNGQEALNTLKENSIDVIISDVMMPEIDGFELCKRIKSNIETSHIPVILLTARNNIEDRIESYNSGADGYITKPFDLRVLEARINNFLLNKKIKQQEFIKEKDINISVLNTISIDEKFLDDAIKIIETDLSNPDLDVDILTQKLSISRSSLYRKFKTITGLSPAEFIRNIRLKHACLLLRDSSITISEVAYAVGFSDPRYFAVCFKNEFNMTPSNYQQMLSDNPKDNI